MAELEIYRLFLAAALAAAVCKSIAQLVSGVGGLDSQGTCMGMYLPLTHA